jgi:hypothetical protein
MRRFYLIAFFLLPILVACSARDGQLRPLRPGEEGELLLAAQPQLVTFSQLQEDPDSFRDRLIRVSGSLLKVPPPVCLPFSGPSVEWALVAEELRLDAVGFERAISLLDDGIPMTVDGFFRLYDGPMGCGKAAPDGSAWFLDVTKIVQPNPLIASGLQPGRILPGNETPGGPIVPPGSSVTPTGEATPTSVLTPPTAGTPGIIPTMTPTGPVLPIPTATSTVGPGTPTVTSIPTASSTAPATSQFTPTPSPTPLPGTPTVSPTPTSTLFPGTPTVTPTPTPTSDAYPGPGTPTATPTVDGYPPLPPVTLTPGYP